MALFHSDTRRQYWRCGRCALVFVPAQFYLSPEQEKSEYDKHNNLPDDEGYRRFLSRLAEPLLQLMAPRSKILEFGCGPGPALAEMMRSEDHEVALYDAFYFPDKAVLKPATYDAITSTEVIEHLHYPDRVIASWLEYLKPSGHLGIMTKTVIDAERFAHWHYKNDLTHVCFYSHDTFDFIAEQFHLSWHAVAKDAFIFCR